jgi:Domain of unknown function (DUF4388)
MAIQGTLKTMNLTDLLQFLAAGRKTGTLKFDLGKISKQVYFQNGLIVGSKSNDPREYLGQILLHYGKVDDAQLQLAREAQKDTGAKLGEVLVEKGFLTESEVLDILKTRTLDAIYDLFIWTEGRFEFYDDEAVPDDLILIEVEPTNLIMEGIYRLDELARYRTLVPSERSVLELNVESAVLSTLGKEYRQILKFVAKRMSVAEICYQMHASAFHVYGQLYELISKGVVFIAGELPEEVRSAQPAIEDLPESITELIWAIERRLDDDPETALAMVQTVLEDDPKNADAQRLLPQAEEKLIKHIYSSGLSPASVPMLLVSPTALTEQQLDPQEGFLLSRINGTWDIESILSICPFREADCLRMLKRLIDRGVVGLSR